MRYGSNQIYLLNLITYGKEKEKRKIGTLIELYYEHKLDLLKRDMRGNGATERVIELVDIEKVDEDELEKNLNKLSELKPFIKWLVENDKIDLGKIKKLYRKSNEHSIHTYPIMYEYSDYEGLLMLLSISDTPIEDLILYLK